MNGKRHKARKIAVYLLYERTSLAYLSSHASDFLKR